MSSDRELPPDDELPPPPFARSAKACGPRCLASSQVAVWSFLGFCETISTPHSSQSHYNRKLNTHEATSAFWAPDRLRAGTSKSRWLQGSLYTMRPRNESEEVPSEVTHTLPKQHRI